VAGLLIGSSLLLALVIGVAVDNGGIDVRMQ